MYYLKQGRWNFKEIYLYERGEGGVGEVNQLDEMAYVNDIKLAEDFKTGEGGVGG